MKQLLKMYAVQAKEYLVSSHSFAIKKGLLWYNKVTKRKVNREKDFSKR
jgi:hypothetical protein